MMKLQSRRLQFYRDDYPHSADQVKLTDKKMQKEAVRPYRPVDLRKSRWVLGDITEVLDHDSWRLGKIAEVLKNDYFVIRLMGCIQLREFHISCLRVPHAYHFKQSTETDRVSELIKPSQLADCSTYRSKFMMEQDRQAYEGKGHNTKRKAANLCPTSARIVKRKQEASMMPTNDLVRRTSKKRKVAAYKVHQPTKKVLPLKVSARNDINGDQLYRPFSDRHNDLAKNMFTKTKSDREVLHLSQIPLHVREENECSVASCSANCLEYSINDDQRSVGLGSCFPDDAMSACPTRSWQENNDVHGFDLDMNVHDLELQAYQSTVRAFYASGPLTWEQESLLTNLRMSLNISNEENLLQLRLLLSS
uniref:ENT domain-containing protein n=1 Tax=Arundo donax TaxID=35708 RepID=A0A0A9FRN7_ARUDO